MRRKPGVVLGAIILVLLILFGLGVMAAAQLGQTTLVGLSRTVVVDAETINAIAQDIARVDLPPGYTPEYGVRRLGFAMASYGPGDGHSHLMLIQIPAWLPMDEKEIVRRARTTMDDEAQQEIEETVQVVEQREIDLGDHVVFYSITESVNSEDENFRSMQVLYPGRNGKVVLILEEPITRWDDARAQALLASLR